MEIIVEGRGTEYFTPDEIVLSIDFHLTGDTYETALNKGVNNVASFIQNIMIPNGFNKEDLKTRSFVVREEKKYEDSTKTYVFNGYSFSQRATLKFDYDKTRLAKLMEQLSTMQDTPICHVDFGVKNMKECKRKILATAYNDAYMQAEAIALAAGKTLRGCMKVDFKPFTSNYYSVSAFGQDMMIGRAAKFGDTTAQVIENTFTPEDIEVSETLYCLWIAE